MGSEAMFLVLMNFFVCTTGGWIAMCRMSKMSQSDTKLMIRWQYVLWFCGFAISGWSFLFDNPASAAQLVMSCIMLATLAMGIGAWRNGAPTYTRIA